MPHKTGMSWSQEKEIRESDSNLTILQKKRVWIGQTKEVGDTTYTCYVFTFGVPQSISSYTVSFSNGSSETLFNIEVLVPFMEALNTYYRQELEGKGVFERQIKFLQRQASIRHVFYASKDQIVIKTFEAATKKIEVVMDIPFSHVEWLCEMLAPFNQLGLDLSKIWILTKKNRFELIVIHYFSWKVSTERRLLGTSNMLQLQNRMMYQEDSYTRPINSLAHFFGITDTSCLPDISLKCLERAVANFSHDSKVHFERAMSYISRNGCDKTATSNGERWKLGIVQELNFQHA